MTDDQHIIQFSPRDWGGRTDATVERVARTVLDEAGFTGASIAFVDGLRIEWHGAVTTAGALERVAEEIGARLSRSDADERLLAIVTGQHGAIEHARAYLGGKGLLPDTSPSAADVVAPPRPFPLTAAPVGQEDVEVRGPGFRILVCAHGARELAARLLAAAERQYCDGYRHGDLATMLLFVDAGGRGGGT